MAKKQAYILTHFFLCIFLGGFLNVKAQAPGSYSTGLRFWIKANASVFSNAGTTLCVNNTLVQQWNDLSGNGFNAAQATSGLRPTFFNTGANGNPVVRYGGTHFLDVASLGISGTSDYFAFCVMKLTSASAGGPSDGNGAYVLDRTTATNELFDIKVVASSGTNRFFFQKRNDAGGNLGGPMSNTVIDPNGFQLVSIGRIYNSASNTLSRIYVNGDLENTQSNAQETTTPPNMRIGRHATNASGGMVGDLAELIVYNNFPSAVDKQKIDSYLAVKYGFSISQSTLTNYLSSNATVIYPATTTHSAYVTAITGIGMDNGSGLVQGGSKNQSANGFVTIQNPSAMGDGDFLLWGSTSVAMSPPNAVDVDGTLIVTRLNRVWRAAHTGTIGTVDVSIDLSTVPGGKVESDLRLLIDRDGDGFADNDVTPLTGTLSGNTFSVAGVDLQHGDYFTIGSRNTTTTPLPIELTEFKSICHENAVELQWSTEVEKDNAYFILQRSDDGENWIDLKQIAGAGNNVGRKKYAYKDYIPNGLKYYRLTQVDLDGNSKNFKLIFSSCGNNNETFSIYPNPAANELFFDVNLTQNYGDSEIRIVNSIGTTCLTEQVKLSRGNSLFKVLLDLRPGVYTVIIYSTGLNFPPQKIIIR